MRDRPRWPLAAVCLYAAAIPFQPVVVMPDGSPLRLAAAEVLAPVVVLAAFLVPRRRVPSPIALVTLAIPALAVLVTMWAATGRALSGYAIGKTLGLVYLVVLCLAVVRSTDAADVPAILRALVGGTVASAVIGLLAYAAWLGGRPTTLVEYDRLCSTMTGDPNIYASLVAVALVLAYADRRASPPARWARCAVLAAALLATGSRSGIVGAMVGGTAWLVLRDGRPLAGVARAVPLALATGVAAAFLLGTDAGAGAAGSLWSHHWRGFTVDSRLALYDRALQQFVEHPFAGLGVGGFRDVNTWEEGTHYAVHNTYLWALVDLGIGGGLLVVALVGAAIARAARARVPSGVGIAAALAAMAVFNLFIDGFYQRHFWILTACALGTGVPARHGRVGREPVPRRRAARRPVASTRLAWSEP